MNALLVILLFNVVASAESISLAQSSWLSLKFNKIEANQVVFADNQLRIDVKASAGPVVHKLPKPLTALGFRVKGSVSGKKVVESSPFDEDSFLRVGVVAAGKQTLSGPRRWLAAAWVKKLFELAPPGSGIDKIHFFAITNRPDLVGKTRTHPKSDLIVETIVHSLSDTGDFDFTYRFKEPIQAVALWLSVDGDDSKSSFSTTLSKIELNPE